MFFYHNFLTHSSQKYIQYIFFFFFPFSLAASGFETIWYTAAAAHFCDIHGMGSSGHWPTQWASYKAYFLLTTLSIVRKRNVFYRKTISALNEIEVNPDHFQILMVVLYCPHCFFIIIVVSVARKICKFIKIYLLSFLNACADLISSR